MLISVARDFSPDPGPRLIRQGPNSGEKFRKILVEKLRQCDRLIVDLDGTTGFGSSFLDEAFGGLVSKEGMSKTDVLRRVVIKSEMDATYKADVEEAIENAEDETRH